jgi:hypothetical protein
MPELDQDDPTERPDWSRRPMRRLTGITIADARV